MKTANLFRDVHGRFKVGAVLWVVFMAFASAPAAAGETDPASAATEFEVDGIKVIVQPRPGSQTVAAGIFFRGGRLNLGPANAGIELLLVASAIEGTEQFPRDTLRSEIARMASRLDYRCEEDFSVLSFRCTLDAFARTLSIAVDAAVHPALAADDVERVRTRLIANAASDADVDLVRRRRGEAVIYEGHPYAPPSEGTPETLRAISIEALRVHHQMLLQKDRMLLVVAGGIDAGQVRAALGSVFSKVPAGGAKPAMPALLGFSAPAAKRSAHDVSVPRADILFAGPRPDSPELPALRMAVSILQSRMFEVVRDREALSYDPSAELEIHAAPHGAIRFSSSNLNDAARLVADQIDRLRRELVPATLLKATAAQLRSDEYNDSQTNEAQVARLAEFELIRGGWRRSFESHYDAVKPADLQAAARHYFANFQYIILGPANFRADEKIFAR